MLTISTPDTLLSLRTAHVGDSHPICPDRQPRGVVYRPRASESHVTSAILRSLRPREGYAAADPERADVFVYGHGFKDEIARIDDGLDQRVSVTAYVGFLLSYENPETSSSA